MKSRAWQSGAFDRDPRWAPKHEKPDVYPKGRRCKEHGCITILNIYNPGPWCLMHAARRTVDLNLALGLTADGELIAA